MKLIDEDVKIMKERSKFCMLCGNKTHMDGVNIQVVSITESGKIIAPYETESSGMEMIVPLCCYHMVLSQQGIIALTTENKLIHVKELVEFEKLTDAQLRMRARLQRNDKKLQGESRLAKAIIEARKFQTGMNQEDERIEMLKQECSCENHKGTWERDCKICFENFSKRLEKDWKERVTKK